MLPQGRPIPDGGFTFNFNPDEVDKNNSESSDSDEYEDMDPKEKRMLKLLKTQQREEQKELEVKLKKVEEDLIQIEKDPRNPEHYEQLLLSNPNSTIIWIKFMACFVQLKEIERAKLTARRALTVINPLEPTHAARTRKTFDTN